MRPGVSWFPSPNFGPRRDGAQPDMVVLHYTAMTSAEAALERLCDPTAEVSAHYLISEQGVLWQLVAEEMRAWHAGVGQWGDARDVNSRSIGIELANTGLHPFGAAQMAVLEGLLGDILRDWSIVPERVIGHSDMAPSRKCDPGARFDWRRLAHQGLSIWPEAGAECGDFYENAARFGYPPVDAGALLKAFRLRFRPGAEGLLDDTDRRLMQDLATRFPVDRSCANA